MKATYYPEKNQVQLIESEMPIPKLGEALIQVFYAGICGSDIHVLKGLHPTAKFPVIPGHEFVGRLVEINDPNRNDLIVGDTVVAQPFFSCGVCEPCTSGSDNVCGQLSLLGIHQNGCFAEYVTVASKKIYKVPAGVDLKLAALTEPIAVAVHDVRRSGLSVGQRAVIIGGGPIGMLLALIARHSGAEIIISEVNEFRLNFAASLGFKTLNPTNENFDKQVKEITKGKGFDVVFEASGSKAGIATMTKLAKIRGTVMVVGMAADKYPVDTMAVFLKELDIRGVRVHAQSAFAGALDIIASGQLDQEFHQIISKTYDLADVEEAFKFVTTESDFFKVLVKVKD